MAVKTVIHYWMIVLLLLISMRGIYGLDCHNVIHLTICQSISINSQ
nr:MAG TPA: hypothetical protein [Crassvirales sp.]